MARWVLLLGLGSGCLSWSSPDPPPRDEWDRPPPKACGESYAPAIIAAGLAGLATFVTVQTAGDDYVDADAIVMGTLAGLYLLDGANAAFDTYRCRAYRAHVRAAGTPKQP